MSCLEIGRFFDTLKTTKVGPSVLCRATDFMVQPFGNSASVPGDAGAQPVSGDGSGRESGGGQADNDDAGESILRRILAGTEESSGVSLETEAILSGMKRTAKRIGDVAFSREAVLIPLVQEVLSPFRRLMAAQFETMCESVSRTLYDDVSSRQRLMQLWSGLRSRMTHEE